ncbi:nucleoporin NUP35-like isoform X1 [Mercenaria mercenaria]|uniref:nucleoporin NUP35-like isoform X1 n=1 Tax=Mercenaria mercenaria TaxID=6596 RepID=UPI001E1D27D9|nr:nucleoporin NUP35-like isoform X1 [Mercenaria mercenaria]
MSVSPDSFVAGHHGSEPMTMGTPTSPTSPGHTSQYLPSYLLGDSMTHSVSPVSSRLWSGSGGSPPRSSHRASSLTSPNISGFQHGTPRLETSMRGKDKAGAPPIRSLLQSTSPAHAGASSPFATPTQYPTRTPGLSTPAPPTTGLSHSLHETMYATPEQSGLNTSRIPTSPAQLDPFYTQGESLTTDDVLDETWITVFGFPPPAASYVLQQFSQYGNILKHVITTEGNWMHIHYQSKIQAKKALSKNGKILGNNIMVGVSHCIDKKVMEGEKENDPVNTSVFSTPNSHFTSTPSGQLKNTPIRPLTAAYMAARSENEVVQNSQAPKKSTGVISKAMEYMFGW